MMILLPALTAASAAFAFRFAGRIPGSQRPTKRIAAIVFVVAVGALGINFIFLLEVHNYFALTTLLGTAIVAFAGFCVWLSIRIVNRREKWAKRAAVGAFSLLLAYPLSIGPACWMADPSDSTFFPSLSRIYWPLGHLASSTRIVRVPLCTYAGLWVRPGSRVLIPGSPIGTGNSFFISSETTITWLHNVAVILFFVSILTSVGWFRRERERRQLADENRDLQHKNSELQTEVGSWRLKADQAALDNN
jgi:hypothetical protein